MKIDGGCHCGKIGFDAEVNPATVVICHCTDCQTMSGAPYRVTVPAKAANFTLRGQPKIYIKTADSGSKRALAFCGECGSPIYSTSLDEPAVFNLRLGVVTQRAQLAPKRQGWCQSAMPWAANISGVPRVPERTRSSK